MRQKVLVINEKNRDKIFATIKSLGPRKTLLNAMNFHKSSGRSLPNFHSFHKTKYP